MPSRLTSEAEETISRTADHLRQSWVAHDSIDGDREAIEYWKRERDYILDSVGFRWRSTSSTRIVCGVSRTLDGRYVTKDGTPVVVKFEPWVDEWDASRFGNPHEIETWRIACDHGDDDLFAPLHDYGDDGRWLAMTECLPVYPGFPGPSDDGHGGDYLTDQRFTDESVIDPFKEKVADRGWYEHDFKHGNVGVHPDGRTVLVDYGSFTTPPEE